jgi:hypothetical protein
MMETPQGKRMGNRPKNSWRRGVISELQAINITWREAKRKAQRQNEVEGNCGCPMSPMGFEVE